MAGVRGELHNALVPPKGLPASLSRITALSVERMGLDGHTFSWLTADELGAVQTFHGDYGKEHRAVTQAEWVGRYEATKQWGYLFGVDVGGFTAYRDEYPKEIKDVRLVFWFDN